MGSLSLNALKAKGPQGLLHAPININGHTFQALIDMGVIDFFVDLAMMKKLNLKIERDEHTLKAVNSVEVATSGIAKDVEIQFGTWIGRDNGSCPYRRLRVGHRYIFAYPATCYGKDGFRCGGGPAFERTLHGSREAS